MTGLEALAAIGAAGSLAGGVAKATQSDPAKHLPTQAPTANFERVDNTLQAQPAQQFPGGGGTPTPNHLGSLLSQLRGGV